uniref:Uncharacterized protein n=1 Tax=Arundo donax TaxID=35708 RepID=A0A0A9Q503_ARUDO
MIFLYRKRFATKNMFHFSASYTTLFVEQTSCKNFYSFPLFIHCHISHIKLQSSLIKSALMSVFSHLTSN